MIQLSHGLSLSFFLFLLGFICVVIRRNILFILIGIEIMLNAASLSLILAGSYLYQNDGQIFHLFIVTAAAAEISIGLALLIQVYRRYHTLDIDVLSEMKG
ncbi:MAG: NADH-quinone oxidoreductase subunit NuoK [Buchnera aphidicola (Eriosoma harunire)]